MFKKAKLINTLFCHCFLGLEDQGLYRVVGVTSKVNRLLTQGLDKKKAEKLNFDDATEVETKTVSLPKTVRNIKNKYVKVAFLMLNWFF